MCVCVCVWRVTLVCGRPSRAWRERGNLETLIPRVYNKEEKRVSNALYVPYKMFSESHAPGIQTLSNESAQFKYLIVSMASSASK